MNRLARTFLLLSIVGPLTLHAHRLDELLQAARIMVHPARVDVELDLTPGVQTVGPILATIDRDRNGELSEAEEEAYADLVRASLTLQLDGTRHGLKLASMEFPGRGEMTNGIGIIRLQFSAWFPALKPGPHRIDFHNRHLTNQSAFLVNALVPSDPSILIQQQRRDSLQREYILEFEHRPRTAPDGAEPAGYSGSRP